MPPKKAQTTLDGFTKKRGTKSNSPEEETETKTPTKRKRAVKEEDEEQEEPTPKRQRKNSSTEASTSATTPRRGRAFQKKGKDDRWPWLIERKDAQGIPYSSPLCDRSTLNIPAGELNKLTPMEQQFWKIKMHHMDKVVFFKKGKFYELYEDDAEVGRVEFGLKMTTRINMCMCGVPESSFDQWASRFLQKGYKVGKVEQTETVNAKAKNAKKVVERKLCQVITVGTITEESFLNTPYSNVLMAIKEDQIGHRFGFVFVDVTIGEFSIGVIDDDRFRTKFETFLHQIAPRELLVERDKLSKQSEHIIKTSRFLPPSVERLKTDDQFWSAETTIQRLEQDDYFAEEGSSNGGKWPQDLRDFEHESLVMSAFGAMVYYLKDLKLDRQLLSMRKVVRYNAARQYGVMTLDAQTLKNLEILENSRDGGRKGTLIQLLDRTVTPYGARMLRQWVVHPLVDINAITERQAAVDDLLNNDDLMEAIGSSLKGERDVKKEIKRKSLKDVERAIAKIHRLGFVEDEAVMFDENIDKGKLDLFAETLTSLQQMYQLVTETVAGYEQTYLQDNGKSAFTSSFFAKLLKVVPPESEEEGFPDIGEIVDEFQSMLDGDSQETGFISQPPGKNPKLDKVRQEIKDIEQSLADYLAAVKQKTKCAKVFYKNVQKDRYVLVFPVSAKADIPAELGLTSLNSTKAEDRYTSIEVKKLVQKLVDKEEERDTMMRGSVKAVFKDFDRHHSTWLRVIKTFAELDCLLSLAKVSRDLGHIKCKPQFYPYICQAEDGAEVDIPPFLDFEEMCHPCLALVDNVIPNDIKIGRFLPNVLIVTGPNMGGKSTLLRQACLGVIMAQLGCYVTARSAMLTPVDKIFTRIGANDRIMAGESTFMVELQETSNILHHATDRSLVILDELGRGTSTFDGMAIAGSVAYYLAEKIRCRTLFSTHYHLLVEEMKYNPLLGIYKMDIQLEGKDNIEFLYKFVEGISEKSYGGKVAKEAGIPTKVVDKAMRLAEVYENDAKTKMTSLKDRIELTTDQFNIFEQIRLVVEPGAYDIATAREHLVMLQQQYLETEKVFHDNDQEEAMDDVALEDD